MKPTKESAKNLAQHIGLTLSNGSIWIMHNEYYFVRIYTHRKTFWTSDKTLPTEWEGVVVKYNLNAQFFITAPWNM